MAPGMPVPATLPRVGSAVSAGVVTTGLCSADGVTSTAKLSAPERLNPFTVSAVKLIRPAGSGARNDQFPAASSGTSSCCVPTVMWTFELAATAVAGAAGT